MLHLTLSPRRLFKIWPAAAGLTFPSRNPSLGGMLVPAENFYAAWRARRHPSPDLRETGGDAPPEKLLQTIWQHQRLLRDQLITLDGRPVRILHPGFKNQEAGPDFRDAMIWLGSEPPLTGDIEIDLQPGGWKAHGHDRNPNYHRVILHVIWSGTPGAEERLPVLALQGRLDAPLGELDEALGREPAAGLPVSLRGQCSAPLAGLPPGRLAELLLAAADVRWRVKAGHYAARARQVGWEQTLWEGLFRGLGYKQNIWPFHRLAELRPLWHRPPLDPFALQTRLLGLSGLLPDQLSRAQLAADQHLRQVWDQWWRERDAFADAILPRSLWRLHGIRPANHPQRRLALAAHWVAAGDLPARLQKWFTQPIADAALADSLLQSLAPVVEDSFWTRHCTLRSAPLARPQPLLGATRVTDLAVNVILPWLWVRAVEGRNAELQRVAEHRFRHWPAAEDNSVLRLARRRLLGAAGTWLPAGAAAQQGLLQITRDFCDHTNALCEQCPFPELVQEWFRRPGEREKIPAEG